MQNQTPILHFHLNFSFSTKSQCQMVYNLMYIFLFLNIKFAVGPHIGGPLKEIYILESFIDGKLGEYIFLNLLYSFKNSIKV